jgi:hypothetical protein
VFLLPMPEPVEERDQAPLPHLKLRRVSMLRPPLLERSAEAPYCGPTVTIAPTLPYEVALLAVRADRLAAELAWLTSLVTWPIAIDLAMVSGLTGFITSSGGTSRYWRRGIRVPEGPIAKGSGFGPNRLRLGRFVYCATGSPARVREEAIRVTNP